MVHTYNDLDTSIHLYSSRPLAILHVMAAVAITVFFQRPLQSALILMHFEHT